MLVCYVRDDKRNPIGVIVCTEYGKIGWSLIHKKDKWIKSEGLALAYGRAVLGTDKKVPFSIQYNYDLMEDRMNRYFNRPSFNPLGHMGVELEKTEDGQLGLTPLSAGEI